MANIKKKHRLDKKVDAVKPPFTMADPNDDAAAYGWSLGKLRYQGEPDPEDPGTCWPGEHVFNVPTPLEVRQVYGHNIEFVCPAFVQLMLDAEPEIRKGAERVRAAQYSPEALKKYRRVVMTVFQEKILPQIAARFEEVSGLVAEFYAARLAHIDTFGVEE
jgi:hypothetical protein